MSFGKNLWGILSDFDQMVMRTPVTILREQSDALQSMTKGALVGELKVYQENQDSIVQLRIVAPDLNHYTYSAVEVKYSSLPYPVSVRNLAAENFIRICQNEEEYEQALGEVLSSQEVRKVIQTLLADVKAVQTAS